MRMSRVAHHPELHETLCWNRLVAMTRDCKSLGFGLRRFESYFQHHKNSFDLVSKLFFVIEIDVNVLMIR